MTGVLMAQKQLSALEKRRSIEKLRLLCSCGAGLEAIAATVCAIARDLIAANSGSIFWYDMEGNPAGFFHDCAPAELKDFFIAHLEELFSKADQFNMVSLIEARGKAVGNMLGEKAVAYFHKSNVYKYLCKPLGHHHCLDIRIDTDARGCAVIALWNGKERPFKEKDAKAVDIVRTQLNLAVRTQRSDLKWRSLSGRTAHMIVNRTGEELISIDAEAESLLLKSHLLNQSIPAVGEMRVAPMFCRQLAAMLDQQTSAIISIPIANGRLQCTASLSRMRGHSGETEAHIFVAIDYQSALAVDAVEFICGLPLTFLQKQITLFAMDGGQRIDCEDRFAVSPEALKKHLRAVYEATGADNWAGLRELFWR
jgi:hypothetical protein